MSIPSVRLRTHSGCSRLRFDLFTAIVLGVAGMLDPTEVATTPFTKAKGLPRLGAHWVRPTLVVQVAFIEWTVHTKLRHPRLLGLRPERRARDVVRTARDTS